MRFLCRIGIHSWGNWGAKFSHADALFNFEFQQRICKCCGKVGQRTV